MGDDSNPADAAEEVPKQGLKPVVTKASADDMLLMISANQLSKETQDKMNEFIIKNNLKRPFRMWPLNNIVAEAVWGS